MEKKNNKIIKPVKNEFPSRAKLVKNKPSDLVKNEISNSAKDEALGMAVKTSSSNKAGKRIIIFFIFAFVLIIGLSIGWFLSWREYERAGETVESNIKNDNIFQGAAMQDETLDRGGFSVLVPKGWKEIPARTGVSAMVVNVGEEITDPTLKKINFLSYYSVSYDTLKARTMDEYVLYIKDMVKQFAPDIAFALEESLKINGNDGYKIEADLNQQGANFKVLIFLIKGKDNDIWNMSFNSGAVNWEKNKEEFNRIGGTFTIK